MLEGYRRIGCGGAFLHPRPDLMTEYLSPRQFENLPEIGLAHMRRVEDDSKLFILVDSTRSR
jgi:hypothetical protein